MTRLRPARLSPTDVAKVAAAGLRSRPLRCVLSALGIAIGIASMVAVVGISSSSRADLETTLDSLGTNLLTVSPGQTLRGDDAALPRRAERMIDRIPLVDDASAIGQVDADVYRNDRIPSEETNGIAAYAARIDLIDLTRVKVATGTWLNDATARHPAVVLGHDAAARLGILTPSPGAVVLIDGHGFVVVGILEPAQLAPELDTAALVGWPVARRELGFDSHPTTIFTRSPEEAIDQVRSILGPTANPERPGEVDVSRPSDALAAKLATDRAFTSLLLGLGAVALLVGGVGVANTMVISVLERRGEIGLRRSLGATRGQVRTQFFSESLLLSALGGTGGALMGASATAGYAHTQGLPAVVPAWALAGGLLSTVLIGAVAGLYPAIRAARMAPTEALATP